MRIWHMGEQTDRWMDKQRKCRHMHRGPLIHLETRPGAAQCWQRRKGKNIAPYCIWDMSSNRTEQFNFSFTAFERCLENTRVFSWNKINDFFPPEKYIVYSQWILHNIRMPGCIESCPKHLSHWEKKCRLVQFRIVPVVIIVINCSAASGLGTTSWQSEDLKTKRGDKSCKKSVW